jgi:twitching motility protein PilT
MPDYILDDLLSQMPDREASDLHLRVGEPPMFRIHGDLERLDYPLLEPQDTIDLMTAKMTELQKERFESFKELDMAYEVEGVARFRVNCFRQQQCVGAVMRMIPIKIKSIEELGLPQILKEFADLPRGLVLVTGPTGSGKSTTLAAMVNYINDSRKAHIITIEDPIEFVHEDRKCIVEQREVGQDTHAFADALKHVMRQTPDVILVGEMRDLETISLAITAAETGHLVFATLHTTDAMQTVDRMVDVFPPQQQQQIRTQLAVTLGGVICQSLLPIKGRPGRVASFEIMKATPGIRAVIREGKTHMIYNQIQSGADEGMIVLDQYLAGLVKNNLVEYEEALSKSSYPNEFARRCGISDTAPA